MPDGDVMVAGGIDGNGNVTATVEFYAPRRGRFVLAPSTTHPHLARVMCHGERTYAS